jgi:hypothetical protein
LSKTDRAMIANTAISATARTAIADGIKPSEVVLATGCGSVALIRLPSF